VTQKIVLSVFLLGILSSNFSASGATLPDVDAKAASEGRQILQANCARCHSIGKTGKSPIGHAPPLRDIYSQYPPQRLEFELSEGIGSRHKDMPQIQFSTEQIDQILMYLRSITTTN
jgi:mono/diheme cytochrome c family protein